MNATKQLFLMSPSLYNLRHDIHNHYTHMHGETSLCAGQGATRKPPRDPMIPINEATVIYGL